MDQLAQSIAADEQSRQEVQQDYDAERDVEPFQHRGVGHKRRRDDEQDRDDVECQERVAKALGTGRIGFIEIPQRLDDAGGLRVLLQHGLAWRYCGQPNNGLITLFVPSRSTMRWPRLLWQRLTSAGDRSPDAVVD